MSGGEPLMQPAYLEALLRRCREIGISTAVDTSGYAPRDVFEALDGLVDLYLFDLKIIDEDDHRTYTGEGNALIHENLDMLLSKGARVMPRIPMIPGMTETEQNIDCLVAFLRARPGLGEVCILPYNRLGEDKVRRLGLMYRPGTMPMQTRQRLREIAGRFTDAGLDVRIGG